MANNKFGKVIEKELEDLKFPEDMDDERPEPPKGRILKEGQKPKPPQWPNDRKEPGLPPWLFWVLFGGVLIGLFVWLGNVNY